MITAMVTNAQNQGRLPGIRERLLNAKFNEICQQMKLGKVQTEQLRPVYMRYEREKSRLISNDRPAQPAVISDSTLTDQQVEKTYLNRLENVKKIAELREKSYPEFRKVLSPRQVVQFQRIEMEINRKMMQTLRKRLNNRVLERP